MGWWANLLRDRDEMRARLAEGAGQIRAADTAVKDDRPQSSDDDDAELLAREDDDAELAPATDDGDDNDELHELREAGRAAAELVEQLRTRNTEVERELADCLKQIADQKQRIAELETRAGELQTALHEKQAAADDLMQLFQNERARADALEARTIPDAAKVFADVLRLPGLKGGAVKVKSVKTLICDAYHPEKHRLKATEDELNELTEAMKTINVAYDALRQEDRARGPFN
jgi:hypothetical protein